MSAIAPPASPHLRALKRRLAGVRRKRVAVSLTTGVALGLTVLLAGLTAEALLDWLSELPWLTRALFLGATLAGIAFFARRDLVRPLRLRLHDDAVALIVERALPVFRSRYISSIQLARSTSHSPAFVQALLAYTEALAATLDFRTVIRTAPMRRACLAAAAALLLAGGLAWLGGPASPILLQRALLLNPPLPRKTQIVNLTGDRKLGLGEDLKIEVSAGGVIPPRGTIVATTARGQKREYALEADPDRPAHFSALLRSPQESFTYVIKLNDATSPAARITTLVRPVVMQLTGQQIFPAYLRLPPVPRTAGDLKLLAGSRLQVAIKASVPIAHGALRLTGMAGELPLGTDPQNPALLRGEIPIPAQDLTGFSVYLVDTMGIASGETATYRIEVVPDQPPTVRITYPTRREELATAAATSRIAFEAKDDYGITNAVLHYTLGTNPEKTIPFDLSGAPARTAVRRFEWKLPSIVPRPQIGDVLEYWITVQDNNTVTGPGQGSTDHYQTRIVTEDEKRLDLGNRLTDTMGGLNEVTGSQEQLNKAFGEIIFAK